MNRTVLLASSILGIAAVVCMALYVQSTRFAVVDSGRGAVYRVDRQTGGASVMYGTKQLAVEGPAQRPPTPGWHWKNTPLAVALAKSAHTDDSGLTNEAFILKNLRSGFGGVLDYFWNAEFFGNDTYVVSFFFLAGPAEHATWGRTRYEVNTHTRAVRAIEGEEERYDGW